MKTLIRTLVILTAVTLSSTACRALVRLTATEQPTISTEVGYKALLGRSLNDQIIADFIAENHCYSAGQLQVCKAAGVDLWLGPSQIVEMVYLYLNNNEGYSAYQGELPFGLKFYDIQGAVEYKLKRQGVGNEGRPDEGSSPDHFHYWAVYKQQKMIIIYNSPFPDEDATIYAIIMSK